MAFPSPLPLSPPPPPLVLPSAVYRPSLGDTARAFAAILLPCGEVGRGSRHKCPRPLLPLPLSSPRRSIDQAWAIPPPRSAVILLPPRAFFAFFSFFICSNQKKAVILRCKIEERERTMPMTISVEVPTIPHGFNLARLQQQLSEYAQSLIRAEYDAPCRFSAAEVKQLLLQGEQQYREGKFISQEEFEAEAALW